MAKKKETTASGPISSDIINIFKDREEPEIFESREHYPEWLFDYVGTSFRT